MHLRQSTASQAVLIGPFVDSDGAAVTGLTIDAADIRLSKNGGNIAGKNSGGGTHDELGMYTITLDATDTNTVGRLQLTVAETGALIVYHEFEVLEEAIYDALYAASANAFTGAAGSTVLTALATGSITAGVVATGAIDADAIADNAIDAGAIASSAISLAKLATDTRQALGLGSTGTLSGTHSDTTADLGGSAPTTDITGQTLYFPDHDISRLVTTYNTGTGVATFDSIGVTLANGNTWYRYPTAPSSGGSGLDAAGVRAAIGLASANLDTQLSTIDTVVDSILVDTGTTLDARIPAALVSGRMDVSVGAMAANVITSTAINNDAITAAKIANGAIDAATFAADVDAEILSYIVDDATRIDASDLNSKIDSLTFTQAGHVDANVQRINDVAVVGAGTSGDKWRA
jgi:hypothetical protein